MYAMYQINVGPEYAVAVSGWGASTWGSGTWGIGATGTDAMRLWSQANFGEDLIYGPRGGGMYYWNASYALTGSTFTVTIATPAVLTLGFNPVNGDVISFTTTGALPTGITPTSRLPQAARPLTRLVPRAVRTRSHRGGYLSRHYLAPQQFQRCRTSSLCLTQAGLCLRLGVMTTARRSKTPC